MMKHRVWPTLVLLACSAPVMAHHPLGGAAVTTFAQGLLSGIGHPLLGIDHLFFVIAVGIAACFTGWRLLSPGFYILGMAAGAILIVTGVQLPLVETAVALTLIIVGILILAGTALSLRRAALLFGVAGLFHGLAFGDSIVGVESVQSTVFIGYLLGLAATQWIVAVLAGGLVANVWKAVLASDIRPRLAGAVVTGVGAAIFLEQMESTVFAMLGWT